MMLNIFGIGFSWHFSGQGSVGQDAGPETSRPKAHEAFGRYDTTRRLEVANTRQRGLAVDFQHPNGVAKRIRHHRAGKADQGVAHVLSIPG